LFVKKLSLKNFRNYDSLDLEFKKNINIIIGNNAQGKTSLVEAMYALSTTKSHRTNKDVQMIKFDKDFFRVTADIQTDEDWEVVLSTSKDGKKAALNGVAKKKLTDFIGSLKVVFFAPEDLEIIKGPPNTRRKFLNMEIGQIDRVYLHHLNQYSKIIKQRNELLKKFQENDESNLMLEVFTKQLLPHVVYIVNKRIWFLKALVIHACDMHAKITSGLEEIGFEYLDSMKLDSIDEKTIFEKYKDIFEIDKRLRTTTIGPHRDDFSIFINNVNTHQFASQGQQRTSVLSIRLAQTLLIKEVAGVYPVLLLDDVLSELDDSRQTKLLDVVGDKIQTFITTTSIDGIDEKIIDLANVFRVDNARVKVEMGD